MTTATPTLDPLAEPLLDEPDRRLCELFGWDMQACPHPAVWALTFRELCGCNDRSASLLLACGSCYGDVMADTQACQCLTCLRFLPLLRAEPL